MKKLGVILVLFLVGTVVFAGGQAEESGAAEPMTLRVTNTLPLDHPMNMALQQFSDGVAELDTRYAMQTHDGAIIEIINYGYRHGPKEVIAAVARGEDVDPASYYMRTHARLETGDARYAWVNRTLFIGVGARDKQSVKVDLYAVE